MEELSVSILNGETETIINYEPIKIEQNQIIYILNIEEIEDKIIFSIDDKEQLPSINYKRTMTFQEIKKLDSIFFDLNSFKEFYDYLKSLSNNCQLNIKKNREKLTIIFSVEVLLKQKKIEINLYPAKKDINLNIEEISKELIDMKDKIKEIDNLKNDNKKLNIEINNIKKENAIQKLKIEEQNKEIKYLKESLKYLFKSSIMKDDEKDIIYKEIEHKMNKKVKEIRKLYQATLNGGEPINFHSRCDNIPNTLVLIQSEGNKRFGGFTPIPWKSEEKGTYIKEPEKKTFIFSLDNKKIYYLKDGDYASVFHGKINGPCFGGGRDIAIDGNPLKENKLYTRQYSYDYKDYENCLSEYQSPYKIKALEYEVFQIIFY